MSMIRQLSPQFANVLDWALGWLLYLPRDLTVAVLAVGTAAFIVAVRKRCTNQRRLERCRNDLTRLADLYDDARRIRDTAAMQRIRSTQIWLRWIRWQADLKVLALVLLPLAAVAIWASERLELFPVRNGDRLRLVGHFSPTAADKLAFLVPSPGIELKSNAVQPVVLDGTGSAARAIASWDVVVTTSQPAHEFVVRFQQQSSTHRVLANSVRYLPPVQQQAPTGLLATEVVLAKYKWLGFAPGIQWLGISPWMFGYLVITLAALPVIQRILKTA